MGGSQPLYIERVGGMFKFDPPIPFYDPIPATIPVTPPYLPCMSCKRFHAIILPP